MPDNENIPEIKYYPSNWQSIFDIKGGDREREIFRKENFMIFTVYDSPQINYYATSSRDASVPSEPLAFESRYALFHPKELFTIESQHNYGEVDASFATILSKGKEIVGEAIKGINFVAGHFTSSDTSLLQEKPEYYINSNKREFSITLNLYNMTGDPREVYDPIMFFKKHSHPTVSSWSAGIGGDVQRASYTIVKQPKTFTISGGMFDSPYIMPFDSSRGNAKRMHLVLTNVRETYNNDVKFKDSFGLPIQATLELRFRELKSLVSEDWQKGKFLEETEWIRAKGE